MIAETLTERVGQIAEECLALVRDVTPAAVTDARVVALLAAMDECLRESERGDTIALTPDYSHFDNHRVYWRRALGHLVADAHWLTPGTKLALYQAFASLPSVVRRSRYELTYDCFSSRIPQWTRDLAPFVGLPDLTFLEIGSFEGHSACWLLDHVLTHETSRLVCVDTFSHETAERLFDANIARTGSAAKVTKLVGRSEDLLPSLQPNRFQFIYVDGGHEQITALQDCVYAWRLLARDGLMTIDDYEMHREPLITLLTGEQHPELAIDAFLSVFAGHYDALYSGYHVTIRKR